ncbi:MAG: glycerol-3-phosphate cytidylyltransferase [Candidatus Buchananbacteria bacterium RIFCSPHIGHO2_01_FULL_44_11]|uniref:Glycerol-3-phosphate cytidylyltransferase n=1 Tax=Candidatus Buchananbacteria bacterium RIFCSPHIGHO2_01_FULL_44_11 TaxID=1797535 RepID=A0A1G1XZJ6_9BACT|nr:MAG: glycerol-3-phosphate cytidylyltransferase [Candidatus Buchananbacteria bacterium RIFCSPHIGHO2_01_FULL_44_11]
MKSIVIVSGYFNPIHLGHIRLFKAAKKLGDYLIVIVNNDKQQKIKKGKIIMNQKERCEIVKAIRDVDEVVLSVDQNPPVTKTLALVAQKHRGNKLIFANGGDRSSKKVVPEAAVCEKYKIEMKYGVGGLDKPNSSSNINQLLGLE